MNLVNPVNPVNPVNSLKEGVSMKIFAFMLSGGLVLSLCVATLAAPVQQDRPGVVVQPRVKIENRGRNEAIPVSIQEWGASERPVNVQVVGTPTVLATGTVQARLVQQVWAYRTVKVPAGEDMANALAGPGADGWETTGVQISDQSGMTLLMKRPR